MERIRRVRLNTFARRLLPLLLLSILVALTVACDAPMSTAVVKGSDNRLIWDGPYTLIMWMAMIVFVAIMLITAWMSIAFRERPGRVAQQIHGNTRLEVLWTLIPVAIVVVLAVPTITTIQKQAEIPKDAMTVIAIGHQWWFEFQYPDTGVITANELHVPEGKMVNFEVRSADVIHAFWVPQLAGKIDMMPGHVNHLHFSADQARPEPYLGQCAELCGYSHANMRFRVFVDTQADFDKWVANAKADAKAPVSPLAKQGQEIFQRSACIGCHTVAGTAAQAKIGPNLTHLGARTTIAAGTLENNEANLEKWIHNSADVKPGSKMPPMGTSAGGALSDDEIKAVAAYLLELK